MNLLLFITLTLALGPQKTELGVEFTVYAPYAENVYLSGSFNNWKPDQLLMKKDSLGVWHFTIYLPPGRYEYKFVVDGEWIADPFNPVQAGPFGNSVIWVDEDGNVSFSEKFKSNVPGNASVAVHGDLRGFVEIKKDTLTRNFYDAKLIFDASLGGESRLWTRLHYSTEGVGAGNVPVDLDRLKVSLRRGLLGFQGFHNEFMLNFDDPITIVGRIGEMQDRYGLGEEGVILTASAFLKDQLTLLYGRNLTDARDLLAGRYKFVFGKGVFGLNFRKRDWHGGTRDELYTFDLSLIPSDRLKSWIELGVGSSFNEFEFQYRKSVLAAGIDLKKGKHRIRIGVEHEGNRYSDDAKVSFRRIESIYQFRSLKIGMIHTEVRTSDFADQDAVWERLFDYTWADRITIPEYPLVAYRHRTVKFVELGLGKMRPHVRVRYAAYSPGVNYRPHVQEGLVSFDFDFHRFGFQTDVRLIRYDDTYLDIHEGFVDPYVELRYAFTPFVALKLSWGLMPYDLDDLYRNREAYLHEKGLSASAAQFSYNRLGMTILSAESALQAYRPLTIWTVIKF